MSRSVDHEDDLHNDLAEIMHLLEPPANWSPGSQPVTPNKRNTEFYHGTGRRLSPGDHILPWQRLKEMGVVEGEAPHGGSHMAWASTHLGEASSYGKNVYKVRPLGDHELLGDGRVRSEHGYEVINDWWKD